MHGCGLSPSEVKSLLSIIVRDADICTRVGFVQLISELAEIIGFDDFGIIRYHKRSEKVKGELEIIDFGNVGSQSKKRWGFDHEEISRRARWSVESGGCVQLRQTRTGEAILYASPSSYNHSIPGIIFLLFFAQKTLMSQVDLVNCAMPYVVKRFLQTCTAVLPTTLTRRELEVLAWAKEGKSYWETSIIMRVSERTVKFHLSNIYKKLNVVNRSQAIAVVSELNLGSGTNWCASSTPAT